MIHITDTTINIHITHHSPMVEALVKAATVADEPEADTAELHITPEAFVEALVQAARKSTEDDE